MKSSKQSKKGSRKRAPESAKRAVNPATVRRLLIGTVLVSGLVITAASFFPGLRLWGVNHLAFYPLPLRMAAVIVMALAWIPVLGSGFANAIDAAWHRLSPSGRAVKVTGTVTSLLAIGLFWLFRASTRLLGDGELVMRYAELQLEKNLSVAGHIADIFSRDSIAPGTSVLYFVAGSVASVFGAPATTGLSLLNALFGGIYVFGVVYFVWKLRAPAGISYLTSLFLLTTGAIVLFFGYVENYTAFFLLSSLFVFSAVLSISSRAPVWIPIVLGTLAVVANVLAVLLLPALAYALIARARSAKGVPVQATIILVILTVLAAVGARSSPLGGFFLPAASTPELSGVFSGAHALDVVNELFLLVPLLPFVALTAVAARGTGTSDAAKRTVSWTGFVVLLLVPMGIFLLFFNPELGMARDWDLFAMLALPLIFLFVATAERAARIWHAGETLRRVMLPATATMVVAVVAWIGVNASEARTIERIRAVLAYDTANANYLYESIAKHYRRENRIDRAIATMNEAFDVSGDPMYLYNSSLMSLERGDTLSAVDGFRRCLSIREQFPQARINLAIQLHNLGEWEELIKVCTNGVRLDPQNPYYHYYFGLHYARTGENELARNRFTFCLRQPIPDDMRAEIEAELARLGPRE